MRRLVECEGDAVGDILRGEIPRVAVVERSRFRGVAVMSHLREFRAHEAWEDLRHADLAEIVETKSLGEAVDREFAGDISGAAGVSGGGGVRANVDDVSVLPLEQERHDYAGDPDHASDVRLDGGEHVVDILMIEGRAAA